MKTAVGKHQKFRALSDAAEVDRRQQDETAQAQLERVALKHRIGRDERTRPGGKRDRDGQDVVDDERSRREQAHP
jgi:hypothetical protein